jgi:hypothetical protein
MLPAAPGRARPVSAAERNARLRLWQAEDAALAVISRELWNLGVVDVPRSIRLAVEVLAEQARRIGRDECAGIVRPQWDDEVTPVVSAQEGGCWRR